MRQQRIQSGLKRLQFLIRLHIESFNFSILQGLRLIIHDFFSSLKSFNYFQGNFFSELFDFHLSKPFFFTDGRRKKLIPRLCRETGTTYKGDFLVAVSYQEVLNKERRRFIFKSGEIPVMVKSIKCNLFQTSQKQMIEIDEEEYETGGYFILNGKERILRLLIVPRRNVVQAFSRISNAQRGHLCTVFSCSIRSVDRIQTSKTFHLHYLTSGGVYFRFVLKKQEFLVPVVILIKALVSISDKEIFEKITNFCYKDKFLRERALIMIKEAYEKCETLENIKAQEFLGKLFKVALPSQNLPEYLLGRNIISKHILIHLGENNHAKQSLLFFMIQKLLSVRKGQTCEDNPDSIENQEFLLPGNLIMIYLKEKIETCLNSWTFFLKNLIDLKSKRKNSDSRFNSKVKQSEKIFRSISVGLEKMISTGSFSAGYMNELTQTSGLSINLERLNFIRFLSYFRSIHRGKFFSDLKNNSGRKLFPQNWGFICPVHTPDGAPCGILNHLASSTISSIFNPIEKKQFQLYLFRFGLPKLYNQKKGRTGIFLDGEIIRFLPSYSLEWLSDKLRYEKVSFLGSLPISCEILGIFRSHQKTQYPSLNISSQESRPIRPLRWMEFVKKKNFDGKIRNKLVFPKNENRLEIIGATEQASLLIKNLEQQNYIPKSEIETSHFEIDSLNILSVIAGLIPFSDLNQSPRNIYQCQMSKQSIGVPFYTFWRKNDSKSYFLLTPQVPICRNKVIQDGLQFDAFPNGINAVVSVLTYTGFDMEDGLVINRDSIHRGFSGSNISTSSWVSFKKNFIQKDKKNNWSPPSPLDKDGFPQIETHIKKGDQLYTKENHSSTLSKKEISFCYNSSEKAVVEQVKFFSDSSNKESSIKSSLKLRYRRKPIPGDKFASRHGQKGVLSFDFLSLDLPFSETGVIPDIVFNPHGFPSRMTIGVILEGIAGKSGAFQGSFQDSSPFRFFHDRVSAYHFGEKLRQSGFQFFGGEIFYSGFTGEPLKMDIFVGLIHYQRLRHMVSDKFQVSEIGPRNILTRQPTKGRKMGGAIRFGEMERDALLGHGCVFLLHDRLQVSSDLHSSFVAIKEGNFSHYKNFFKSDSISLLNSPLKGPGFHRRILIPYVLKYLVTELASINIKIILSLNET